MTTLREAAQQALERLRKYHYGNGFAEDAECIADLEAALAQQVEPVEPVAWYQKRGQEVLTSHPACWGREDEPWTPLYTAPPQRLPLTEEEIYRATGHCGVSKYTAITITRAVERAHGIKE